MTATVALYSLITDKAHSYNGVHLRRRDLLGSLHGTHDLLLMLEHRHNTVMVDCWAETLSCCKWRSATLMKMSVSLPPVTGKAAPEHKSHSVSSLFQPTKKANGGQVRPDNQKMWDNNRKCIMRNSDHLFVHFNVQSIGHFIVLEIHRGRKTKIIYIFCIIYSHTQSAVVYALTMLDYFNCCIQLRSNDNQESLHWWQNSQITVYKMITQ